jgi:GxxExxY protein
LGKVNIPFEKEKALPVPYEDITLEVGFRCDFLVNKRVIVECKSVKEVTPLDHAQLLNYLKITNLNVGLLIDPNKHQSPIIDSSPPDHRLPITGHLITPTF